MMCMMCMMCMGDTGDTFGKMKAEWGLVKGTGETRLLEDSG